MWKSENIYPCRQTLLLSASGSNWSVYMEEGVCTLYCDLVCCNYWIKSSDAYLVKIECHVALLVFRVYHKTNRDNLRLLGKMIMMVWLWKESQL